MTLSPTETTPDSAPRDARRDAWLILLLAGVTAIGPFTLHLLTPALPQIAVRFEVSAAWAQPLLSVSLIAMALANLAWGPLSDRYGRRPVLLAGLAMGALGSALAALAPELWMVLIGRILQAAGGSAGMVLARAVAQDVFGSARSAGVIGQITAVMVAAPMIAPTLSGLVVQEVGWRGIFWISAACCALLYSWTYARLAETAPRSGPVLSIREMGRAFLVIGGETAFWRYAGYAACSLAGFYYFVGITPYVMQQSFDAGPAAYGFYFVMLSGTYMLTNFLCGPVTERFGAERVLIMGSVVALLGPLISIVLLFVGVHEPIVLFAPGMLQSLGAGLAVPNAMARAVSSSPGRAGAASGLLGASQFLLAAVTTQLGSFLDHSVAMVVPAGVALMMIAGLCCLFLARRTV